VLHREKDPRRAGAHHLAHESHRALGNDLQPCPELVRGAAQVHPHDVIPGQVLGHRERAKDGLNEGHLALHGLGDGPQTGEFAPQCAALRVKRR